ncbi:MAG: hypothetical protein ACFCUX_10560 [Candidatus Methylacidiphilales bacterium]
MKWFKKKWTLKKHLEAIAKNAPLARCPEELLFATNHSELNQRAVAAGMQHDSKIDLEKVHGLYNRTFDHEGKSIRYCYYPAVHESHGLVVSFHSVNGYAFRDHVKPWACFDVLAPLDDFGVVFEGMPLSCGFYGTAAHPFVAGVVQALIRKVLDETGQKHCFFIGGSLGGFGALFHGLSMSASGLYVMTPQIDIAAMSQQELAKGKTFNSYTPMLDAGIEEGGPDVFRLARSMPDLPPLFLIQSLYDQLNPFASHAYKLLEMYHSKKAWYGLRIHPAIGHRADGSIAEAEYFFLKLLQKGLPRKAIIV